jgi:type II secretory pathway pseudopilin PulG
MYCAHCGTQVESLAAKCPSCGKPASGAPPPSSGGASPAVVVAVVVGSVLVVVMIMGILAAIAVPNLINAINRGRQKRTMLDMKSLGAAIEAYAGDNNQYPSAATMPELATALEPKYLSPLPQLDGWRRPLSYACWQESPASGGCDTYRIVSAGRDGIFEQPAPRDYDEAGEPTTDFDDDIVYGNGTFLRYPEGISGR